MFSKKSTHVVVKFCAYISLGMHVHKCVFQSSHEIVQMKWGQEYKCIHPSMFWNRRNFWPLFYEKKHSYFCQILRSKKCRYAVSRKEFFNLVKKLFKRNEGNSRSVCILVGSEREGIFDLGFYEKKYSCRRQICAYISLGTLGSQKMFFNLVKKLFKRNEGNSRSVCILVGSEREGIFDLGFYEKKYSCRCQILRLYKSRYARFTKSDFQSSWGLVQTEWGLE